jgi:hypothetical protein
MFLTEYVRWANKVEGLVVWERAQNYGASHQEYLLELEGKGVFAVVTAWKKNDFETWVLVPDKKDIKAPAGIRPTLRAAISEAATVRAAWDFAGQEIRYEPNPAEVGNG